MNSDRLRLLFEKYATNSISEQERSEFFQLVSDAKADDQLKEMLDDLWSSLPEEHVHVSLPNEIYPNILKFAKEGEGRGSGKFLWLKVAAAFAVITLATAGLFLHRSLPSANLSLVSEKTTPERHESFVRLPDGSTVVLNAGSKLDYPGSFEGKKTREVYLEGEAFFDIRHDPEHPFIVHSGDVFTTVLGTSFNIRAFVNAEEVVVTVTRGKVQVSNHQKVLGVIAGDQQITIHKATTYSKIQAVNSGESLSWMERDIFFDDVTMEEAVAELENRFNVEIKLLNDDIRTCRFTATFVKGEDLEQILLVICEFNKVSFDQTQNAITIDGAGCK